MILLLDSLPLATLSGADRRGLADACIRDRLGRWHRPGRHATGGLARKAGPSRQATGQPAYYDRITILQHTNSFITAP